jgi:hypothetical protein
LRGSPAKVPMTGGFALLLTALAALAGVSGASANPPPSLEPNFAAPLQPPRPCAYDGNDRYERRIYRLEGWKAPSYERYPGACERLRFAHGPILVKPGQNDVLVEPVLIPKPSRDGYITRLKPDLVRADGTVPPVEQVHLHHGVWLSIPEYGGGAAASGTPFAGSGEEKTIATMPRGYGLPIRASDQWLLLYMVHSAVTQPMEVFITYEIDFIPAEKAKQIDINPVYPIWLDVRPSAYPVFNVQRSYGGRDRKCVWPRERCSDFDPWGRRFVGQGMPGNSVGTDFALPARGGSMGRIRNFTGGTLVGIAGHLHPGGLTDNIGLVRGKRSRRIFTSEAIYWNRRNPNKRGGPPTSWDFSMTGTGLPYWGIRVRPGDRLRINAAYDTRWQATYEDMGIAMLAIAPNRSDGSPTAPGLNPFKVRRDRSRNCWRRSRGLKARPRVLCDKGLPTHGHQAANGNYGGPDGQWTAGPGAPTRDVGIANFKYYPGDFGGVSQSGVPTVKLGDTLRFTNFDGTSIYHSITTCRFPCLGATGASFPIANGRTSSGRRLDLDSGELGIGAPEIGPAKQDLSWRLPVTAAEGFQPGETVTYFCRIHPFMRGAFQVTN